MTDSIEAIVPSPDAAAIQSAHAAAINQAAFQTEIMQAELANEALTLDSSLDNNQPAPQNDISANDGLLNLNSPTLVLFNEANLRNANINESLTAQQMQDISRLLKDEKGLEAAAHIGTHVPLTSGVTTVDLSVEAQAIAEGVNTTASVNTYSPLTPAQWKQVGTILAPVANEPLTPHLLHQIQTQLAAAGVSPQQFNLNTIFMVMSYIAAMQPAIVAVKTNNSNAAENGDEETVAPASPVDRVAVENMAILP